ncbi:MAG: DUF2277 domain-containing protein [Anaerolineales bacterium]|nr:DUF2277 domain-containing protein [Chloroflexota bacterium]MBL6980489.1 DUF2277 domain-containing protein [Anaerolineales bacterium]
MCRNIKTLYNFDPPATDEEIVAAALQFIRKISGFSKPSLVNQAAFDDAIEKIAEVSSHFLDTLETNSPPKNREVERSKARARNAKRYST